MDDRMAAQGSVITTEARTGLRMAMADSRLSLPAAEKSRDSSPPRGQTCDTTCDTLDASIPLDPDAAAGIRTRTPRGAGEFKSPASPSSATPAWVLPPERRRARGAVHGADAPVLDLPGPGLGQDRPALEDLRVADVGVVA